MKKVFKLGDTDDKTKSHVFRQEKTPTHKLLLSEVSTESPVKEEGIKLVNEDYKWTYQVKDHSQTHGSSNDLSSNIRLKNGCCVH